MSGALLSRLTDSVPSNTHGFLSKAKQRNLFSWRAFGKATSRRLTAKLSMKRQSTSVTAGFGIFLSALSDEQIAAFQTTIKWSTIQGAILNKTRNRS
jgi:hypothetical protein